MLSDATPLLQKIAYRDKLTTDEVRSLLNLIGTEDVMVDEEHSDGLFFLALTFGLMAKGPTAEELQGFALSISDQSVKFTTKIDPANIIDVSGTGGDKIKTFNIGTTASFVIAAGGVNVAKQATQGYTGLTGSADIYREIGLDPFKIGSTRVAKCLEDVGLAAFYTPAFSGGFKNRMDFLRKLKTIKLSFPTPWHLVSWVYSPFQMNARLYGVFDRQFVRVLADLFKLLGYKRAMVVHGLDGLDEISNVGETFVAELHNGEIKEFTLTPEESGIQRANPSEIETLTQAELAELRSPLTTDARKKELHARGYEENVKTFFRILYGKERGPKRDIVALNAAAALYLCGKVDSVGSGVELANQILDRCDAVAVLRRFAAFEGGEAQLRDWERRLNL